MKLNLHEVKIRVTRAAGLIVGIYSVISSLLFYFNIMFFIK